MDPVSNLNRVLAVLRRRRTIDGGVTERVPDDVAHSVSGGQPSGVTGGDEALAVHISQLKAAGLDDRDALARAAVEWMLTQEFGPALSNESEYQHMIDAVVAALADDTDTSTSLSTLIGQVASDSPSSQR